MKKKIITAMLTASLLLSAFASCTGGSQTTDTSGDPSDTTVVEGVGEYDPALDDSTVKLYESGDYTALKESYASTSSWVVTDGLDRTAAVNSEVGDLKDDKFVAVFFSPWHGTFANQYVAYNNQQILDKYPDIDKNDFYDERWGDDGYHFWNEPIYGYYNQKDEWVIRRQAEMLAAAGVDALVCDNTNGTYTWADTINQMLKVFNDARADGVDVPQIIFHLPFFEADSTVTQAKELYNKLYSREQYADNWFMWEGKPLIIASPDAFNKNNAEEAKILEYFTFRRGQPDYLEDQKVDEQWGWLSMYPQATYRKIRKNRKDPIEQMTVGVAQNHDYVAKQLTAMNGDNVTGRTYTSKGYDTRENAVLYGANFAEQFEYAIEKSPQFVLVSCYNEWVAIRQDNWSGINNAFADQYNDEFSRDIEPTKGVLKDHYYYQMVDYIRKFKGADKVEDASKPVKIDINGGYGQWAEVGPRYISYAGNTGNRNSRGYKDPETMLPIQYKDQSGRNDLYDFKVARDNENVYFMARCVENITPYTDEKWMHLYLDVNTGDANWETFDYILNKQTPKSESVAVLEKFTGNGFETEVVGDVEYKVNGNVIMVKIPKTLLGITSNEFTVNFKWCDNVQNEGDIMDFYVSGDVAPTGRFKYQYNAK
ncbi:MAG: hypothetical protein IKL21_07195 [Clostridia bacterium]|nr:hypothetical protein [Clostridia bacterium]